MRENLRLPMAIWLIVAIPLLIMLFTLAMERVEHRLRKVMVAGDEVEEFLEQAQPEEVGALYRGGIGRALELFRLRRRRYTRLWRTRHAHRRTYTRPH